MFNGEYIAHEDSKKAESIGSSDYFAHSLESRRTEEWHLLEKHLLSTAKLASQFASGFGCGEWGYIAGLWHDLGKYSKAFQSKIRAAGSEDIGSHLPANAQVDHSTAGALYSIERFNLPGRILAYLSAGHHAGLADWQADNTGLKALSQRLLNKSLLDDARQGLINISSRRILHPEQQLGWR